ncbi:MAG TPA: DUF4157 domain-containing protein [Thermoanaerobaculia bacterium]|jgi:hypothetical protein|nr:DUF4157 domain-containing protein [Thermoanaerobaculia bacterium]
MKAVRSKTEKRAAPAPAPAAQPVRATGTPGRAQLQSALKVSSPSDPAEKEAEATARRIVRQPLPSPSVARFRAAVGAAGPLLSVARKAAGQPPDVTSNMAAEIAGTSSGSPLPPGVRRFMEPRFRADFGNVRVHAGERAAGLSRQLNAQAFTVSRQIFFGRGRFQPESEEGRELLAHELTHTIQQGAAVQRSADVPVTQQSPPQVQRLGLSDALDYFADRANNIPGFRMFTIILGVNPINMSRVERSAANILRAVVELLPGGALITQALDNHGVFDRVGNWVEQQIRTLGMTGSVIRQAIDRFLDSLSWRDVFNLGGVWERARRIFTDPIDRILSFARGLVTGILGFIKDAILRPLARLAEGTRGYDLLKAVLGEDPVTGDPVPRNAETLIGGFMRLIGQEEIWQNIQRSNAVARAWAWFQGALSGLMGFVRQIPSLFVQAFRSLEIADIILVPRAFARIASVFGGFIGNFLSWAGNTIWNLLEIIFAVVAPNVMVYLRRAAGAFRTILRNPIGFVGNLVRAGLLGLRQFAANFLTHLRASLIGWLTGAMSGANVYIPQGFNLREILKFVLSVLGLTWQNIRGKLVRAIGETAVRVLETGFDIVVTLVTEGPAAAWQKILESLSNLRDMVMEQIMTFVRDRVVQAAITRLVTSLNPAGAFIQAIIAIYNTVMFFRERLSQIAQVAAAFIDSISAIASGVLSAAANRVEQTMAGLLTLVISFLARIAGLGRVSDAVTNIIDRVRQPIDRALDRVVAWIVATARRLGRLVTGGPPQPGAAGGPDVRTPEEKRRALHEAIAEGLAVARQRGATREVVERVLPGIAQRYRLRALRTVERGESFRIHGEINPEEDSADLPKILPVARAVASVQRDLRDRKTPIEISVATLDDARAVIAQAFPQARQTPSPTPGGAFRSHVDMANIEAFRNFRQRTMVFHVDVQRYRVSEIRARLQQEIAEATALRDRSRTELQYHIDNPAFSMRNQENRRAIERNLANFNQRLSNLQGIASNLSQHESEWRRLEAEGVLYGHATVDPDESRHRTNPHVNVEGLANVTTRTESFQYFVKVAIFVRRA